MKKLFFFASAAALLVTSCSDDLGFKNQGQEVEGNFTITASYTMGSEENPETRTELVTSSNGKSKQYQWSQADAIGVFNSGVAGTTNAMFSYSTGTGATGNFKGNLNALSGSRYIGYYPYYAGAQVEPDQEILGTQTLGLKMTIPTYQNYNSESFVVGTDTWTLNAPSGSFSPGEAPAVGYGYSANGQTMSMTFFPIASYLVFPVTTTEAITVTSVELTVSTSAGSKQNLAGSFYVNVDNVAQGWDKELEYEVAAATSESEDANGQPFSTIITLNCGKGVKLGAGQTTNFWFVVPADLQLTNATVEATVYADGIKGLPSSTLTKTLGSSAPSVIGSNQIQIIVPDGTSAWVYNNNNTSVPITTIAQFLEYAYLVTNPQNAVELWNIMRQTNTGDWLKYSNLQNMCVWAPETDFAEDVTSGQIYSFKNASIVGNLQFSPQQLISDLGFNQYAAVPEYYKVIYQNYMINGSIPTIGGNGFYTTTIQGANSQAALTNLGIAGQGFVKATKEEDAITIKNLTLNGLNVTYPDGAQNPKFYYLLASPDYTNFSGVTVASNCKVSGNQSSYDKGLFYEDESAFNEWSYSNNSWSMSNNVTGVTNQTDLLFANSLNINSAYTNYAVAQKVFNGYEGAISYDFTKSGRSVDSFNDIYITSNPNEGTEIGGYGAVLNVAASEDAAFQLMAALAETNEDNFPYSVVDGKTSYWTGLTYPQGQQLCVSGTAEYLATMVQNGNVNSPATNVFTKGSWDLDLMGTYQSAEMSSPIHSYWWTRGYTNSNVITLQGSSSVKNGVTTWNPLNITNVYINGTTNGKDAVATEFLMSGKYNFLTLLGNYSTAQYVNVNNIEITPDANATVTNTLVIGAISSQLGTPSSNINVTNMNVNVEGLTNLYESSDTGVLGGLYYQLTQNALKYNSNGTPVAGLTSVTVSPYVGGESGENETGYLAGTLNYTLEGINETLYNPYSGVSSTRQPFGVFNLIVNPSDNFASSTINLSSYGYYNSLEKVSEINISTTTKLQNEYSVYIVAGGKRYLYQYNSKNGQFQYQGTISK